MVGLPARVAVTSALCGNGLDYMSSRAPASSLSEQLIAGHYAHRGIVQSSSPILWRRASISANLGSLTEERRRPASLNLEGRKAGPWPKCRVRCIYWRRDRHLG
jgi:hypothetical protein